MSNGQSTKMRPSGMQRLRWPTQIMGAGSKSNPRDTSDDAERNASKHPAAFLEAKTSLLDSLKDKLATWWFYGTGNKSKTKVDPTSHLEGMIAELQDDPEVASLGVPAVLADCLSAKSRLEKHVGDISDWAVGCDFDQRRAGVLVTLSEFEQKFAVLKDYESCVRKLFKNVKYLDDKVSRKRRYAKSKTKDALDEGGCPEPFSIVVSDAVFDRKNRFEAYASTAYSDNFWTPNWDGSQPATLHESTEGTNHVAAQVTKSRQDEIATKVQKNLKKVRDDRGTVCLNQWADLHFPLPAASASSDNPAGSRENAPCKYLSACIVTSESYAYNVRLENIPLPGIPCVITVALGYAQIIVVPMENLMLEELSFDSISSFFEGETAVAKIQKLPGFGVPAHSSIVVPFGHVPVVVGVGSNEGNSQEEPLAYTINYFLDAQEPQKAGRQVKIELHSLLERAKARSSGFVKANKKAVGEWMSTWKVAEED